MTSSFSSEINREIGTLLSMAASHISFIYKIISQISDQVQIHGMLKARHETGFGMFSESGVFQFPDRIEECINIPEIAVNGSESDIRHFVKMP